VGVVVAQDALVEVAGLLGQGQGLAVVAHGLVEHGQAGQAGGVVGVVRPQQLKANLQRLAGQRQCLLRTAALPE
jgi:hypothetical protein